jgi:hypothetical protein
MCTAYALLTHFCYESTGRMRRSRALSATMIRTWEKACKFVTKDGSAR